MYDISNMLAMDESVETPSRSSDSESAKATTSESRAYNTTCYTYQMQLKNSFF